MVTSRDPEKAFGIKGKLHPCFIIKSTEQTRNRRKLPHMKKGIHKNPQPTSHLMVR